MAGASTEAQEARGGRAHKGEGANRVDSSEVVMVAENCVTHLAAAELGCKERGAATRGASAVCVFGDTRLGITPITGGCWSSIS